MKNSILITCFTMLLFISSCSKNDDAENMEKTTQELIVGSWDLQSFGPDTDALNACQKLSTFEFLDNGSLVAIFYGESGFTPLTGTETDVSCGIKAGITATYTLNDRIINLTSGGGSEFAWTIETITETDLVILDNSGSYPQTYVLTKKI